MPNVGPNTEFSATPQDAASTLPGAALTIAGGAAGTTSLSGRGGDLVLAGGSGGGNSSAHGGGDLVLAAGGAASLPASGYIILAGGHSTVASGLPTADPSIKGALYGPSVSGAVSVSGG